MDVVPNLDVKEDVKLGENDLKEGKDVMMNVNNEMEVGDEKLKDGFVISQKDIDDLMDDEESSVRKSPSNNNVRILNVHSKDERLSGIPQEKKKDFTPFNYTPPKPNSRFLFRSSFKTTLVSPVMNVFLNNLTECEIVIQPDMTKEEIILKALQKFGIDKINAHLYTLSLWIEHKENIEIINNIFETWEQNNNVSNIKFHLHRTRANNDHKNNNIKQNENISFQYDESKFKKNRLCTSNQIKHNRERRRKID